MLVSASYHSLALQQQTTVDGIGIWVWDKYMRVGPETGDGTGCMEARAVI